LASGIRAVAFDHRLCFAGEVHEFRHAALHAKGHFVLGDASFGFGVAVVFQVAAIDGGDVVKEQTSGFAGHAGGVAEVGHGVAGIAKPHALEAAGEEAGAQ
jgi:hypothetical protein